VDGCRQVLRDPVVEPHLPAVHHVGQDRCRKRLGNGADLEDATRVDSDRDDPSRARSIEQSDDDSLAVFSSVRKGLNARRQHDAHGGIGWQRLLKTKEGSQGGDGMHARI